MKSYGEHFKSYRRDVSEKARQYASGLMQAGSRKNIYARRRDEKEAFVKRVVERLAESPGVRPEDIFLILDNNSVLDDYSFGKGVLTSKLFYRKWN